MIEDNKESKEKRLLDTAFKLFTEKGVKNTSIQDIVDNAKVAKGTFYLYFKDKYEIRDILIAKKSEKLFSDALEKLRENYILNFSDQIVFVINYIIDEFIKNPLLLRFISKNLSWGVYSEAVLKIYENDEKKENGIYALFIKGVNDNNIPMKNPDVTLFMIIELVSSTCFSSISYEQPLPIDEYKEYLFDTIRKLINN